MTDAMTNREEMGVGYELGRAVIIMAVHSLQHEMKCADKGILCAECKRDAQKLV
jgi:hypothetical protein